MLYCSLASNNDFSSGGEWGRGWEIDRNMVIRKKIKREREREREEQREREIEKEKERER